MSKLIVSRFGGNAAANSDEVKKTLEIIKADDARRYLVVSAPGSTPDQVGITDLLYMCHASCQNHEDYSSMLGAISDRYKEIIDGLGMDFDIDTEILALKKSLTMGMDIDYIGSRGEYIIAKILAAFLGWEFVDATGIICFKMDGTPDTEKTFVTAGATLKPLERAVIPSFYGSLPNGKVKTFVRGDCDTAGALVACSVKADVFEKWSEGAKIYSADPAVIPNAEIIRNVTYTETVEMNYIGINIVKDSVAFMLNQFDIPMKICSTHTPKESLMLITPKLPENVVRSTAACIAGHNNFTMVNINKYGLNKVIGFGEKLFGVFAKHRIACQHYLTGIHKMSIIIKDPIFDLRRDQIIRDINGTVSPDSITVEKGLSLIAIVGEGMGTIHGTFSKIFDALAKADVKVRMIDQGSDDLNIIIGVHDEDYKKAITALYHSVARNEEDWE
jgi:aspartate kinase